MSRRFVRGAAASSNNGGGKNKWTASSSSFSRDGRGPLGRGRSSGRGGRFSHHSFVTNEAPSTSNKWVRPATEKQVGDDNERALTADIKSFDDSTSPADNVIQTITSSSSDVRKSEQSLERRGRNKLVMKKMNECVSSSYLKENKVEGIVEHLPTESEAEEKTFHFDKPEHNLERRGRHKLVMKKNEPDISSSSFEKVPLPAETKAEETIISDVDEHEHILERRGRHKLVMRKDETETLPKSSQNSEGRGKYSWKRKPAETTAPSNTEETDTTQQRGDGQHHESKMAASRTSSNVKRKRPEPIHGPRRIFLSSTASEEGRDVDGMDGQPQKTMTDFQYKDASARGGGKAMGLVRVKPKNPSETPICPTFSRGLPCNNAKCRLRHDVSTEASRPICVFFQRNGMCSKGDDCPFKHVKVSWDAEICPTFNRLGYCEDEGCVFRHVTTSSKRSKTRAPDNTR